MDNSKITIKQKPNIKEALSLTLFDKNNPEMVTYLFDKEINRISAYETVIKSENELMEKLKLQKNIFANYIKSVKVHRTSRKGLRAEQGVKVITSNVEDESAGAKTGVFGKFAGLK